MKIKKLLLLLCLCLGGTACESNKPATETAGNVATPSAPMTPLPPPRQDDELLVIESSLGKFSMAFYPEIAPKHMEQIKKLVREGFYNGLAFHRVIPNGIIQGGDPQTRNGDRSLWGMGMPEQPTIPAEFSRLGFKRGTVGMARKGNDNNSATSQFFVCLEPHPEWDGKYTIIGEIVQGLSNVQIISNAPTEPGTEKVREKVVMKKVYLEKRPAQ
jgi:cyclophilin family peptidyl-prolyl cis-trans isomerase